MSSVTSIKQQIKSWEHRFEKEHHRLPSKQDVKSDPKIYKLYKNYRLSKTKSEHQKQVPEKPTGIEININVGNVHSDQEPESEEELLDYKNVHGELGPTPQANGKVLSIFDFRLTPPDSSPLKQKETNSTSNQQFRTPTKLKPVNEGSTIKQKSNLADKLLSAANSITPTKTSPPSFSLEALETPQYLAKTNRKFEFSISPTKPSASPFEVSSPRNSNLAFTPGKSPGDSPTKSTSYSFVKSSPFNSTISGSSSKAVRSPFQSSQPLAVKSSPFQASPIKTPVRSSTLDFSVSPSPLKPHRFISKKLSDVFNDFKSIQEEENHYSEEEEEIEEEQEEDEQTGQEPEGPKRKKKFTQKRTTRRWKIKPRHAETGEDELKGKDIHKEIDKINKQDLDHLSAYIDSNDEESEESDHNEEYVRKEPQNTKGMIKPISNNYQRLKINDPRSRAFKRRMGR